MLRALQTITGKNGALLLMMPSILTESEHIALRTLSTTLGDYWVLGQLKGLTTLPKESIFQCPGATSELKE